MSQQEKQADGQGQGLSRPAHALSAEEIIRELSTNADEGLSSSNASQRLAQYGRNELEGGEGVSFSKIVIRQIANAMMLVLIIAMAVSFAIQSWIEGGVIAGVIGLNIVVGVYQDYAAEKTMDSLRSLSSPTGVVTRDNKTATIPAPEIVPGDMVELKVGDTVPADLRLVEAMNFETDEALLTGESLPVAKDVNAVFDEDTGPGDRLNIAYSSSTVTSGRSRGVVVATGMKTEIGAIATALRSGDSKRRTVKRDEQGEAKKRWYVQAWTLTTTDAIGRFLGINVGTPLQRKLSKLALLLFAIAVVFAIIVMGANGMANDQEVIIYAVATGLAMIPACLIVVLTITMAVGTKQMVERHVIVRRLDSLEALGAITNICSDKTGTLTQGKMVAKRAWIPSKGTYSVGSSSDPLNPHDGDLSLLPDSPVSLDQDAQGDSTSVDELLKDNMVLEDFLNVASMANLAHVHQSEENHEWNARGEPTDIAIQVFAARFDWNRDRWTKGDQPVWQQKAEYPFDSSVKKMSVIFARGGDPEKEREGREMIFTKGAVERVLEACTHVTWTAGSEPVPLDDNIQNEILQNMEALAKEGLRVLAFACRENKSGTVGGEESERPPRDEVENGLVFCGLMGLYDPPRTETAGAIRECYKAGISVHMVTGDHPGTARTIAAQVGIIPANMDNVAKDVADAMVMTASQFDKLSEDEIDQLPTLPLVIARCAPNTKVRMINALHRRGRYVAMTGDGVNDSPSLKQADVGIAMGLAGSDVAKDASELVLTDDNFASIINGIEEGRRIFDNIQRFVLHLLAENVGLALTLLIGLAFKDEDNKSVFPIAPVEILWIIMITSGLPDMGLGMEIADPEIMDRPPQSKQGIFTWEIIVDTLVYGVWMAALCLASFSLVMFGWGDGNLAKGCNSNYNAECDTVFRARATTFVCMTWFALFLAWEMVNMRRSFFRMQPESKRYFTQWMFDVWRNKFLFWGIMAGFVLTFPILYIPVINDVVFKHTGISWEWGVVFVEALLFVLGVEAWKWCKRIFFRRRAARRMKSGTAAGGERKPHDFSQYITMSRSETQRVSGDAENAERSAV